MERIRQLRNEKGLSQAKLAVAADMDPATLNRLEQGKGNPNLRTLERVADALGVEVADLLGKAHGRSSPELTLWNSVADEERRGHGTTRESEHLKDRVRGCLDRWGKVARGEDPNLAPDHAFAIEVFQHMISLIEWCGELLHAIKVELPPAAAISEHRDIVRLIDALQDVAAEIGALADAAEGVTREAVDAEAEALIDAEVKALVAKQRPDDQVAQQRASARQRDYVRVRDETQRTARQRADEVKRLAAGE